MKAVAAILAALVIIGLWWGMTQDWSNRRIYFYEQVQECVDRSSNPSPDASFMECKRIVKERGQ